MNDQGQNAFIFRIAGDNTINSRIRSVLLENGYKISESNGSCSHIEDFGPIIVPITKVTKTISWLDDMLKKAGPLGKKVIGVWSPESKDSDLPESLLKYAHAIVCPNNEQILAAIAGKRLLQDSNCAERTIKDNPRHIC